MNETADFFEQLELPCFFKENFGYECPGCGFQTAFVLLLRGRLWESIEAYPPLPFLLFLFAFFIVHLIFRIKNGELIMHWAFRISVAAVVINYIWKLLL